MNIQHYAWNYYYVYQKIVKFSWELKFYGVKTHCFPADYSNSRAREAHCFTCHFAAEISTFSSTRSKELNEFANPETRRQMLDGCGMDEDVPLDACLSVVLHLHGIGIGNGMAIRLWMVGCGGDKGWDIVYVRWMGGNNWR